MKPLFIYNPKNLPEDDLPWIVGFNNGGQRMFEEAVSLAEDGTFLGNHVCSCEGFMIGDLCLDRRGFRTQTYEEHYPDGFRTTFVGVDSRDTSAELQKAIHNSKKKDLLDS